MSLKPFYTTTGEKVWVDDRHVLNVYGEENNVKLTLDIERQMTWTFQGTPADAVRLLNQTPHTIVEVAQ